MTEPFDDMHACYRIQRSRDLSDKPMAKLTLLKRPGRAGSGLLGKLRHWLKGSDYAIISAGEEHVLPAPVGLGMYLVFRELYDPTGG